MRKRAALILLSMMVAVSLNAQGIDEYRKISSWLCQKVLAQKNTQRRVGDEEKLTVVFVQLKEDMTDEQLAVYQCRRYAQLDDIAIVMLPISQVEHFSHHPTVLRIEANEQSLKQ